MTMNEIRRHSTKACQNGILRIEGPDSMPQEIRWASLSGNLVI